MEVAVTAQMISKTGLRSVRLRWYSPEMVVGGLAHRGTMVRSAFSELLPAASHCTEPQTLSVFLRDWCGSQNRLHAQVAPCNRLSLILIPTGIDFGRLLEHTAHALMC